MTWAMWAYGTSVFFVIQVHLGAPPSVLILPAVCMACSVGVAIHVFARGRPVRPDRADWAALAVDSGLIGAYAVGVALGVVVAGEMTGPALVFVAAAGLSALTSATPILRSTYVAPWTERPLAWFVWSTAYGLLCVAALLEGLPWAFLVYPAISQIVCLFVGLFAAEAVAAPEDRGA
jgi:hypothetical protein